MLPSSKKLVQKFASLIFCGERAKIRVAQTSSNYCNFVLRCLKTSLFCEYNYIQLITTSEVARGQKWKKCDFFHFLLMRPPPRLLRSERNQFSSLASLAYLFLVPFSWDWKLFSYSNEAIKKVKTRARPYNDRPKISVLKLAPFTCYTYRFTLTLCYWIIHASLRRHKSATPRRK